jgi:hypothetical protein
MPRNMDWALVVTAPQLTVSLSAQIRISGSA